jgi:hypothetical protein
MHLFVAPITNLPSEEYTSITGKDRKSGLNVPWALLSVL